VSEVAWVRLEVWVAAICTLGIYSFLYRENKFYRFFEYVFMGVAGGWGIVVTWTEVLRPKWWEPMVSGLQAVNTGQGDPWGALWVLALPLGSMWYFIYSRKHAWVSRIIFGLFMGAVAGMSFRGFIGGQMPQLISSFKPLNSVNNIIFVVTLVCVMLYFFFSFEQKNPGIRRGAAVGRWLLMIAFGAMFGNTVMARMSLFIERFQFLAFQWLGLGGGA
jgi:hypothetical protein